MNNTILDYIELFDEKADQDKLVVFVGSGVSKNVKGMPSWYDLILNIAQEVGYEKCVNCYHRENCEFIDRNDSENCPLKYSFSTEEYLKIPQYLYNKNPEKYYSILKTSISSSAIDAPLSSEIFNINPSHIITTNYDKLLESSSNELSQQYSVIVKDKDLLMTTKGKYIIKMHGDINDLENIVFKESDYLNYSENHVVIETFVKSLLTDHILLFLGYSLSDYNIKLIISWINFMRSKNELKDSGHSIGYIVLDENNVDDITKEYYAQNGVEVVDISSINILETIPDTITNEKGKRLYSFLSAINNDSNRAHFLPEDFKKDRIEFIIEHGYLGYRKVLDLLKIKWYDFENSVLYILKTTDYEIVKCYSSMDNGYGEKFKQILANYNIRSILCREDGSRLDIENNSNLEEDSVYLLYLDNKYDEILELIEGNKIDKNKAVFYKNLIDNLYYEDSDLVMLPAESGKDYLYNAVNIYNSDYYLYHLSNMTYGKRAVKYLDMINSKKERTAYSRIREVLNGNDSDFGIMNNNYLLERDHVLDQNTVYYGRESWEELKKIKTVAIDRYYIFFCNHVVFNKNAKHTIFNPYISGIICANSEAATFRKADNTIINYYKYPIDKVDFDIMTKYISSGNLRSLIKDYHIKSLDIEDGLIDHIIVCYENITDYIIGCGNRCNASAFLTLSNITLLLNYIETSNANKKRICSIIEKIVKSIDVFIKYTKVLNADITTFVTNITSLLDALEIKTGNNTIRTILKSKDFYDFVNTIGIHNAERFLSHFISAEECDQGVLMNYFYEEENNINKQIIIEILEPYIYSEYYRKDIIKYAHENFSRVSNNFLLSLANRGDFILSDKEKEAIKNTVKNDRKNNEKGYYYYPSKSKEYIELICILYIMGDNDIRDFIINFDEQFDYIDFLKNPECFDYTKVDFSDYMWVNFIKTEKLSQYFIDNKSVLIPKLEDRVKNGFATENEKVVLYGFLLSYKELVRKN